MPIIQPAEIYCLVAQSCVFDSLTEPTHAINSDGDTTLRILGVDFYQKFISKISCSSCIAKAIDPSFSLLLRSLTFILAIGLFLICFSSLTKLQILKLRTESRNIAVLIRPCPVFRIDIKRVNPSIFEAIYFRKLFSLRSAKACNWNDLYKQL